MSILSDVADAMEHCCKRELGNRGASGDLIGTLPKKRKFWYMKVPMLRKSQNSTVYDGILWSIVVRYSISYYSTSYSIIVYHFTV